MGPVLEQRSDSMCGVHFRSGRPVHLSDARRDPMFADNPWVDGRLASVRCYASIPLVNRDGFALGTLRVFDSVERCLTDEFAAPGGGATVRFFLPQAAADASDVRRGGRRGVLTAS